MKPRILLAALAAAVVVFIWQTISHMALPWHQAAFSQFKDAAAVQKVLEDNADGPGMYMVPWADHHDEEAMKQAMEQWDTGFSMFASVRPNGSNSFGESFVQQFVWNFLGAFFIAFLLVKLNLKGTTCKVGTTVFFALFTVVVGILPNWTWWGFGNSFIAVNIADTLIGWTLAGFVLAKLLPYVEETANESTPEPASED